MNEGELRVQPLRQSLSTRCLRMMNSAQPLTTEPELGRALHTSGLQAFRWPFSIMSANLRDGI